MKRLYLILMIVGFILPNIFVAKESVETGNILLYTDLAQTMQQMFANDVTTAFIIDLLFIVILFMVWSFREAKKHKMNNLWLIWLFTFAFGIASGLPLFLYLREKKNTANKN